MIEAKEISKTYHASEVPCIALRPTTLKIEEGEFAAVCGPSGSGKTTLLNILSCLDSTDSGEILFGGEVLDAEDKKKQSRVRREKFGFVFQTYNLIPVLSVYENILLPLTLLGIHDKKECRSRIGDILAKVGLAGLEERKPLQLSGGQHQRVSIARALVKNPKVVFADEPTANLDLETGERVIDLMREINKNNGTTFLFSTHDQMIMKHASRLINIRDGKITTEGA